MSVSPTVPSEGSSDIDLEAYLVRIGYAGDRSPTIQTLRGLHLAHATTILFENLDIQMGRLPIRLDLASLQAKLVAGGRGGYCFEQNTLFAAVLESIGFRVTRMAARVRMGRPQIMPRTHMILRVDLGGEPWLADVGFGGEGLLEPLPMDAAGPTQAFGWEYRVVAEGSGRVLRFMQDGEWMDLYAFIEEEQYPADFEMGNHYTSTHPDSGFVRALTVQSVAPEERMVLRDFELSQIRPGATVSTSIPDRDALIRVLAERFGLHVPSDTRFRFLDGDSARGE